ncbi:hypothetical protein BJ170DRAFT_62687 [Xylariales sp. AK1849]|nr:hypothetical protein BJ170DRAFT_62687 [Xylariales sp. AK1849]
MASNQAAPSAPKPLAMMTKLSPFVSFHEPAKGSTTPTSAIVAPKLILVASWMDARDVHIAKYITHYQALYPTSTILLVKFVLKQVIWESEGIKAVQPAIPYLRSKVDSGYLSEAPSRPEILVHAFSNGGVASTRHLFEGYQKKTGQVFPLHAMVYDSCPGLYSYWGAYNASMAGVPKGIWRWVMSPTIHLLDIYLWIIAVALRRPYALLTNANWHNEPENIRQTNRAYIYGRSDEMVDWQHVRLHTKQAEAKGFAVRQEMFQGSSHVAHMRVDEGRYWKIVTDTWESAFKGA